eukprot:CAMPEP_0177635948 /NCGR_PEP_ID=MMETSP0447-20121125/4176_1 /TAXON_ID=0 /ORGANISM="Stygamoeba regulata, Strain BSH-02190019" /LENGTH=56 /DNA_ID=CAMNT_0019137775 /DNA_START=152 /DNA_END=319 /DNA_ORIENTATION=+
MPFAPHPHTGFALWSSEQIPLHPDGVPRVQATLRAQPPKMSVHERAPSHTLVVASR